MSAVPKKISSLQKKRDKIGNDIDRLLKTRNHELLNVLERVPAPSLDANILVGGLLHVCDQAVANPELANQWRETGQKFRRKKTSSTTVHQSA